MAKYYDELLKLCAFEDTEIEKERPRLEKAFKKLGLGPADFTTAVAWVKKNHDIQLLGARKILGIWMKELVDLDLAREEGKKLVYYGFPTIAGPAAVIATANPNVFCTCPDAVLCITMGQIFNKLGSLLEAGEANGLPPGYALCSLQQVRAGGLAKGIIPVPDLALFSSYFCDMGSKADELFHEVYGHPAVYVDGSMDSRWGEYPNYDPARVDYLGNNIEKIFKGVKEYLGVEVTEEHRREGATRGREVTGALNELVELMKKADPQPISIVTIELARRLTIGSTSPRIIKEAPAAIALLNEEVKDRMEKGIGVVEKGAPKIMIFIAHFSDPSIAHMVESSGLSIPFTFLVEVTAKTRRNIPNINGKILAESEMARGMFYGNYGSIRLAADIARDTQADGVLWNYLYNCRPWSEPGLMLKRFVEKETGIPVLALESDLADSRSYSAEALRTRVETFAEVLRAKKAAKG